MMQPTLTIGLALYRSDLGAKRAFLSAYLAVLEREDLELLICDNNPSADREFLQAIACERVRYVSNSENLGGLGNFFQISELARGEWFLWLGDDDFLDPFFCELFERIKAESMPCHDVIASAPTLFTKGKRIALTRVSFSGEYIDAMGSADPLRRVEAFGGWRSHNYLFYSMYNKARVDFYPAWFFYAYCPGLLNSFDITAALGVVLCHSIGQLESGFYSYCTQNFESGWERREIDVFRRFLVPGLASSLDDSTVMLVYVVMNACRGLSYFLALGLARNRSIPGFNLEAYLCAARSVLLGRHLSFAMKDVVWGDELEPSVNSFLALIDRLSLYLVEPLLCGGELREFLLGVSGGLPRQSSQQILDALKARYGSIHHVSI